VAAQERRLVNVSLKKSAMSSNLAANVLKIFHVGGVKKLRNVYQLMNRKIHVEQYILANTFHTILVKENVMETQIVQVASKIMMNAIGVLEAQENISIQVFAHSK